MSAVVVIGSIWGNEKMSVVSVSLSGVNWCKKVRHEIDDFCVNVLCFTPCKTGCANCPEHAYKQTKTVTLDCHKMKDAYACLKARCDYAMAKEPSKEVLLLVDADKSFVSK